MGFKSIALAATTLVLSTSVNSALMSTDWQVAGDNLITHDTISGLNWLDLSETNNMSPDVVTVQLGTGGFFEGWRYATSAEVINLWNNFNVDLNFGVPTDAVGVDNNVIQATSILGGTFSELNDPQFPTGVAGFTTDTFVLSSHYIIGAYIDTGSLSQVNDTYTIYLPSQLLHSNVADAAIGSYLVKTSVVPVPAAIWLFGSGLIGLIGVARRKKA